MVYHNLDKVFWINLDAFKESGFGTIVFHIKTNNILLERK